MIGNTTNRNVVAKKLFVRRFIRSASVTYCTTWQTFENISTKPLNNCSNSRSHFLETKITN